jgi:8-oxo-dGTP diphosphatase
VLRVYDVKYLFKFHASKIFKIKANGDPIPSNEIHHFAFYKPGKKMSEMASYNTLKILKKYFSLKL